MKKGIHYITVDEGLQNSWKHPEYGYQVPLYTIGTSVFFNPDNMKLIAFGRHSIATLPVQYGDKVKLDANGGYPKLVKMIPPKDPVLRALWELGCFKGRFIESTAEFFKLCYTQKQMDAARGFYRSSVIIFTTERQNLYIAFQLGPSWWRGPVYKWTYKNPPTKEEAEEIVNFVRSSPDGWGESTGWIWVVDGTKRIRKCPIATAVGA